MISSLRGILVAKAIDEIEIEVGGVGYRAWIPLSTYERLGAQSDEVRILTYLHVRAEELTLYGFGTERERRLFVVLLGVAGIGPRLALHVLSRLTPGRFVAAVLRKDLATLTGISGVGKKTAERMILELKDKVVDLAEAEPADAGPPLTTSGEDAVKALIALGIPRPAAERAVQRALVDHPDDQASELTRHALTVIHA